VLKARKVSKHFFHKLMLAAVNICFQFQLAPLHSGNEWPLSNLSAADRLATFTPEPADGLCTYASTALASDMSLTAPPFAAHQMFVSCCNGGGGGGGDGGSGGGVSGGSGPSAAGGGDGGGGGSGGSGGSGGGGSDTGGYGSETHRWAEDEYLDYSSQAVPDRRAPFRLGHCTPPLWMAGRGQQLSTYQLNPSHFDH
jgi:hypothetical protein